LIALGFTVLTGFWVRQSEIVVLSTAVSESVPAIPGVAALIFLLPINALLRRIRGIRPLTRGEILVIFLFVTVACTMMAQAVMRFLFALICSPFYFAEMHIASIQKYIPGWMVPKNTEVIRHLYEHAPDGRVPWSLWWQPGLVWMGFYLALWWTLYCMMALFYRAWAEEERLSFPLTFLPIEMTGEQSAGRPFFRNGVMWAGFAVAAAYNLINIAHALHPAFPALEKEVDLAPFFTNPPWSAVAPLMFHFRPELIGLGFLVSTEISLTVWVSFLLMKLAAVAFAMVGYPPDPLPYPAEQGIGAYLVIAILLLWLARHNLRAAWRLALRGQAEAGPEGILYRWLFVGLIGGFLLVWGFAAKAGMAGWVACAYLIVVLAVALVYGRLRAETGVPLLWLFPVSMQKSVFFYTFGSGPFLASGQATLPIWGVFTLLARGYFPEMTGYQVEAMELARRTGLRASRVALALCLAVIAGFAVGWFNHLTPYYHYGAQQVVGGAGIWGTWVAIPEYRTVLGYMSQPKLPDISRIWATCVGGLIVAGIFLVRLRFAGFLLHPLGYAMTCCAGDLIWGSFVIVWIVKSLVLRYGGMPLYRNTVPFFLGLALGHFAVAGVAWGLLGAWTGDAVRGYQVWFG
jgi:hypothetical protein